MTSINLELRHVVELDGMKGEAVLKDVKVVDGVTVFKVSKTDSAITRILCGTTYRLDKPMSKTTIVEQLQAIRNSAVDAIINPDAADDLGLGDVDYKPISAKKRKAAALAVPRFIAIESPTVGSANDISMQVMTADRQGPLWLELSTTTLQYLVDVCRIQLSICTPKHESKPDSENVEELPKGISYDSKLCSYRARTGGKNKYFCVSKLADAKSSAVEWLEQQ